MLSVKQVSSTLSSVDLYFAEDILYVIYTCLADGSVTKLWARVLLTLL